MKQHQNIKSWMMAILVAVFISACATTQEEMPAEDGAATDQSMTDGSGTDGGTDSGADATGLDGSDTGDGTAIVDSAPLSAAEMLEQPEGALANRTIYFEYDSAKLTSESIAILETHGDFIAGNGEISVRLEGHADERGSREYNIALGDRRALSVRRVLLFQGASSDQVETVSYGEEKPVASGQNEEAWSMNRRVELIYTVN
ncbi:MAG: peptidoglycan-associated lipoprotein Pal [Gammaproteobacteria bacterium]|nr:peptidoglycan-associated lipoprotein Pal [Gammaproteobacteria bacterium]